MKLEYKKALFEVYKILENTDKETREKIPKRFINFIKENMDENHEFKLEEKKELINQNLMLETKQIIALIYRDYLCDEKERKELLENERNKNKENKVEENNKNSYEINFGKIKENENKNNENKNNENKNNRINRNNETKEEKSLIRISNEKWYRRLLRKILEIFKVS